MAGDSDGAGFARETTNSVPFTRTTASKDGVPRRLECGHGAPKPAVRQLFPRQIPMDGDAFVTMLAPAVERRCHKPLVGCEHPGRRKLVQADRRSPRDRRRRPPPGHTKLSQVRLRQQRRVAATAESRESAGGNRLVDTDFARPLTETPLKDVQAAWDPKRTSRRPVQARPQRRHSEICTQMVEDFGFLPKVSAGRRQRLSGELQGRLGGRYDIEDEVAAGRFSILFKARQKNPARTVGIKLFVASEFDEWATECVRRQPSRMACISPVRRSSGSSNTRRNSPQFLITEFVDAEPLNKYLQRYPNGVPLSVVTEDPPRPDSAFVELHDRGRVRGELCPSNILIQPSGNARIATVDFSAILSNESIRAGELRIDRESLAYMTPERFLGQPHTQLSDQFSLGLIAMELLGGERMPRVTSPRDLEDKGRIFQELENGSGAWSRRSEGFSGLVSRLLRTRSRTTDGTRCAPRARFCRTSRLPSRRRSDSSEWRESATCGSSPVAGTGRSSSGSTRGCSRPARTSSRISTMSRCRSSRRC